MRYITWVVALFVYTQASSQILFTYGKDSVPVKTFLQAYNKNNNNNNKTPKALQEYLDLYIASRLKIREAAMRRYDTLPQLKADVDNLRSQIVPLYEKDQETENRLVEEAFNRSQKDIHIAHIFIGFANNLGVKDSAAAAKKATEAMQQLNNNMAFAEVAKKYSDDPSVKINGGDLGYITVFTLPYPLENLAYQTPAGKISGLYRSSAGYHIFKNLGERKALGKIKGAQILIAFLPESSEAQKKEAKKLADSLYNRILKGDDFAKLAAKFSGDVVSAPANGLIPEFGVSEYDPVFENAFYNLKNGAVSKPFLTSHGYHIVKRMSVQPVSTVKTTAALQALKEKVNQNERISLSKEVLAKKVFQLAGFKKLPFSNTELWEYTDSLFSSKPASGPLHLSSTTPVFILVKDSTTVADWITFSEVARYREDGGGFKPYPQVWDEFVNNTAINYYTAHLEDFNADFNNQMTEFKEGNLFFEIMQREVWGPAQNDTIALKEYYQKHSSKYAWGKSASAILYYASDLATAQRLAAQVKNSPNDWKQLVGKLSEKVTADSGRFEWQQIPNATKIALKKGLVTSPVLNKADNTASFAYILQLHEKPAPRSFEDAKALVINDYQQELDKRWIEKLKEKYPVHINQAQWSSLLSTAKK